MSGVVGAKKSKSAILIVNAPSRIAVLKTPELVELKPVEATIGATAQAVIDTLFVRITAKEYQIVERLPSERTLAAELGVPQYRA
jgi:hypothetical protein